jgi:hypothetical protein
MEKRKTVYITAAAIAAAGGLAGVLAIYFKHDKAKDAILIEDTDQISKGMAGLMRSATIIGPESKQITNASTVYAAAGEEFPEVEGAGQAGRHSLVNFAAKIIRLSPQQPDQPNGTQAPN